MTKKLKSLGQIAYEGSPEGGIQNWGPWDKAPEVVRRVHERMAKVVERAVKRRMKADGWISFKLVSFPLLNP